MKTFMRIVEAGTSPYVPSTPVGALAGWATKDGKRPDTLKVTSSHRSQGEINTQVTMDPSFRDLTSLVQRAAGNQLRGKVSRGHVYVWPAREASHTVVMDELGLAAGGDFWIIRDGFKALSVAVNSEGGLTKNGLRLVGVGGEPPELIARLFQTLS